MKRTISILLTIILCFSVVISINAAEYYGDFRVNESNTVMAIAPNDELYDKILYFNVYNEEGNKISSETVSSFSNELPNFPEVVPMYVKYLSTNSGGWPTVADEYILWDISFIVGTPGKDRKFTFVPVTADGEWNKYAFSYNITIYPEKEDYVEHEYTIGEEIAVNIAVPNDGSYENVKNFKLYNENGGKISIRSVSSKTLNIYPDIMLGDLNFVLGEPKDCEYTIWTITYAVATAGDRVFKCVPVTVSGEKTEDAMKISVYVHYERSSKNIHIASSSVKTIQKNELFGVSVKTGSRVQKLDFYNESWSKIGKKLVSRIRNTDGTLEWNFTMSLGTAGNRTLTARADDNIEMEWPVRIIVTDQTK